MTTRRSLLWLLLGLLAGSLVFGIRTAIRSVSEPSFQMAWTARLKSDDSVARQILRSRLDDPAFRDPRLLLQAGLLVRQGRAVDAADLLHRIGPDWRERPETRQLWGEILYSSGRLQEAEIQFLRLVGEDPSRADLHLWLGAIYYDQLQLDHFLREVNRSIQLSPTDYRPHRLLGLTYHRFYRFGESATHFQEALRLGGITGQEDIVAPLAQARLFNREYSAVVELIAKVPNPTGEMWALLAEAHLNLGSDQAVMDNCIEQALKVGRHDRRVLQFASQIFIDNGRVEEAIEFLNEILIAVPHFERAHYLLSRAYLKLGRQEDYERAIEKYKVAEGIKKEHFDLMQRMTENPNDVEALSRAELIAAQMGEPELAKLYSMARASRTPKEVPNR